MKGLSTFETVSIYLLLVLMIALGGFLRLQNLPLLEGRYFIGSDPYRHLRHSLQIVEQGNLPPKDMMRHAPLGVDNTTRATFFAWLFAKVLS